MLSLNAQSRELKGKKKIAILRKDKLVPSVVYGHKTRLQIIQIKYKDLQKTLNSAGTSTLIELKIGEKEPIAVLVQDVQYDPIKGDIKHVDFYQITKGEKINIEIQLVFIGESPAVKALGGILVKSLHQLKAKCLPKDLVSQIEVDISGLNNFGDEIKVKDLKIPAQIEISDKPNEVVVSVAEPEKEEVIVKPVVEATAEAGPTTETKVESKTEEKKEKTSEK